MMDICTPVTNIELAKEFYLWAGCSHFHMAREYPDRYEEYRSLNISKDVEYQWKTDYFELLFNELMQDNSNKIWQLHHSMAENIHSLNTDNAYEKMLIATRKTLNSAPDGCRIIVAETINGRSEHRYRSGLIYHCFDRGMYEYAKEFARLSLLLAESDNKPESLLNSHITQKRITNAINDCKSIQSELGL